MKISLNQINTVSGDIKGNFKNIFDRTNKAFNEGSDIVVFPETSFTGYCVGALWDNTDFIFEQENCIRELMKIVTYIKCVIVGYNSFHDTKPDGFPL